MKKKPNALLIMILVLVIVPWITLRTAQAYGETDKTDLKLEGILDQIEARYDVTDFSADFFQESVMKAIDVTDTASGRAFFKRPGNMRWEYQTPEQYFIISDGEILWIYRPEDKQVTIGKAPSFFGEGKGASFLSDIKQLRKKFDITLKEDEETTEIYVLKLIPKKKDLDLSEINLHVTKRNFYVIEFISMNAYNDIRKIMFSKFKFEENYDNSMFTFEIPEDVEDVLELDN